MSLQVLENQGFVLTREGIKNQVRVLEKNDNAFVFMKIQREIDHITMTALHYACMHNLTTPNVIKTLKDLGADVNAQDQYGLPPIFYAIINENDQTIGALLKFYGQELKLGPFLAMDIDSPIYADKFSILKNLQSSEFHREIVCQFKDVVIECHRNPEPQILHEYPFAYAIANGHIEAIHAYKEDLGLRVDDFLSGDTPERKAQYLYLFKNKTLLRYLAEIVSDEILTSLINLTTPYASAEKEELYVHGLKLLNQRKRYDILTRSEDPMLTSMPIDSIECFKILVNAGCDINGLDETYNKTPFIRACMSGHIEIAKALLENRNLRFDFPGNEIHDILVAVMCSLKYKIQDPVMKLLLDAPYHYIEFDWQSIYTHIKSLADQEERYCVRFDGRFDLDKHNQTVYPARNYVRAECIRNGLLKFKNTKGRPSKTKRFWSMIIRLPAELKMMIFNTQAGNSGRISICQKALESEMQKFVRVHSKHSKQHKQLPNPQKD